MAYVSKTRSPFLFEQCIIRNIKIRPRDPENYGFDIRFGLFRLFGNANSLPNPTPRLVGVKVNSIENVMNCSSDPEDYELLVFEISLNVTAFHPLNLGVLGVSYRNNTFFLIVRNMSTKFG